MNNFKLHQELIEQAPDAVIFANDKGEIEFWNNQAQELFGHTQVEALGSSLDLIIPDHLRAAHWKGFHQSIKTGMTKYHGKTLITKSMRKDGSTLYLNLTFSMIKNEKGEVLGAEAIIRDITEQYLKEKKN